ncbi:MAG TPA: hypothetical protein VGO31_06635 [Microbacteriaceae bacterium]|jgi:hypothetical protein|nr:hypothetical protein [Microbacteriaceae bacterium]
MGLVRHQAAIAIVAAAAFAVGAVFVFARPTYHQPNNVVTVAMADQPQFAASIVRRAFAKEGIHLRPAGVLSGVRFYADVPERQKDEAFSVTLYAKTEKVMFDSTGPQPMYSTHFANVSISYGGSDAAFARRVEAAASALRDG